MRQELDEVLALYHFGPDADAAMRLKSELRNWLTHAVYVTVQVFVAHRPF